MRLSGKAKEKARASVTAFQKRRQPVFIVDWAPDRHASVIRGVGQNVLDFFFRVLIAATCCNRRIRLSDD